MGSKWPVPHSGQTNTTGSGHIDDAPAGEIALERPSCFFLDLRPRGRQRWAPTPDGGYSFRSPLSDPIPSDASGTASATGGSGRHWRRGDSRRERLCVRGIVQKSCRRSKEQAPGDGATKVQEPVVVAWRTARPPYSRASAR